MTELIWSPEIFVVGETKWNPDELDNWIQFNDPPAAHEPGTPLHRLWSDVHDDFAAERMIEFAGRHCYRSWSQGRAPSDYIRNILDMEHGSVLEHSTFNLAVQGVSRSFSLELVRHRVGVAISQESQRYVDAKDIKFVVPPVLVHLAGGSELYVDNVTGQMGVHPLIKAFALSCEMSRGAYQRLQEEINLGLASRESNTKRDTMRKKRANEAARSHLPNAAETRLTWTANVRLLRHFFFLRGGYGADLEIRRFAVALLETLQGRTHTVFADLEVDYSQDFSYGVGVIKAK